MEELIIDDGYKINLVSDSNFDENYFIKVISQSKYLTLLKDRTLYHLRVEKDLDSSKLLNEKQLANYLISEFPFKFDEKLTPRRSGDINRFIVSRGSLVKENYYD